MRYGSCTGPPRTRLELNRGGRRPLNAEGPPASRSRESLPSEQAGQLRGELGFHLLVEAVQDYAIFLLSTEGKVLTWNIGAQRIKGYAADEIIGQHFSRFYTDEDRAADRPGRLLGLARKHGRVEDEGWRVRSDGSRFWADVVVTALRDAGGATYGYVKITRDLTERRASEEQHRNLVAERRAREAAEEALKARDRFLSIASHELKTPVAALQLAADNLVRARGRGRLDDERLGRGLERIVSSTERLGVLVNELLDVSRLTSGSSTIERRPTDVVAVLGEVIGRFAEAVGERRIRLEAPATAVIDGDPSRLDQVFTNLLDNALKYSDPSETVEVAVADDEGGVRISVADRGIGLDEQALDGRFEAFTRGDNVAHVQGLGLGLFISHRIVERHDGRIEGGLRGDGPGSIFRVWLPRPAS